MAARRRSPSWGSHMTTPYLQKIKREAAQAAYVAAWRAEHPTGTWGEIWGCPLCGKVIQTTTEGAQYHQHDIEAHQEMHGLSWTAYQAAGTDRATAGQPTRVVNHSCGDPKCTDLSHLAVGDLPRESDGDQE